MSLIPKPLTLMRQTYDLLYRKRLFVKQHTDCAKQTNARVKQKNNFVIHTGIDVAAPEAADADAPEVPARRPRRNRRPSRPRPVLLHSNFALDVNFQYK